MTVKIIDIRHPEYTSDLWLKYDAAYTAGHQFVEDYVEQFSLRETTDDFINRKKYSYTPAFAKEAINEVKNSIFQRISDVTRVGGSEFYNDVMHGLKGGVDLAGSTMNIYIGRQILPELLVKGKVGIYVDMPVITNNSKIYNGHPYYYIFKAENILSWDYGYNIDGVYFKKLLLRENVNTFVEGLPNDGIERYRYLETTADGTIVKFYNEQGDQIDQYNNKSTESYTLNLPMIPFVIAELTQSLMVDVADYQVALANLASADMSYGIRSNFPFYTEQVDYRVNQYSRTNDAYNDNTEENSVAGQKRVSTGAADGRQYPLGAERPGFIHPSPEPFKASMEKQQILKKEIKELVHLALTNVEPKMASAESKEADQQGLEAGLSYIGLELEATERQLARIWNLYEGNKIEITIAYPKRYSIKSDTDKQQEAERLKALLHDAPSITFKREIIKRIATIVLGDKITQEKLNKIYEEINTASILDVDPMIILKDLEAGLVDLDSASDARGYPIGSSEKAKQDHAERLARIAAAQSNMTGRGVSDTDGEPNRDAREDQKASHEGDI